MSELQKLVQQKYAAAKPANPPPKISKISNFSRGAYLNSYFVSDDKLRSLIGDDWLEISQDPVQLEAFRGAAETIAQLRAGIVPSHYTATTTCKSCGPVPIFEDCPPEVFGCPWCFNRIKSLPIPKGE